MGAFVMSKEHHPILNTNTLDFLKQNVLTVTDLTRSNKLSEILDRFSTGVSEEVFVIQNGKKKNAQAVMLDMDYFEQLLQFKEIIEASLDQVAMEEAYGRIGKPVNQSLSDVFDEEDINVTELIKLLEED
ncbi:hypothetical protein SAMN05421839_11152 [Halolactibacillus halophilus]|uniref:Antitoxin n=2 Tax=Halolactibacillus halophilus TaxID=306540 RepID=A0A1I5NVN5_9BACI|nr:hypothetical protein HHA03_10000 [Halolactibacillus halophilus]SFP25855.1 hypothetical protein SAMN05421839_11152 [Halolactibacillus halophilus]